MGSGAVLVTGASTGIGRATALTLAEHGMRVFAGVRRDDDGARLRADSDGRVEPVLIDVGDDTSVAAARDAVQESLSGQPLTGVVNNAGIAVSGPVEFVSRDEWRRQFEINLLGAVSVVQQFLPILRESRGRIVNISSVGGRFPQPLVGPYVASKHALETVSDVLRVELRPWGIGVSLIEPGSVATPIWEKGLRESAQTLATAPAQLQRLYGRAIAAGTDAARTAQRTGVAPERVALAVLHALTSPRPRTRYVIGRDARMMLAVKRVLPDRWRDEVILRVARMPRRADA